LFLPPTPIAEPLSGLGGSLVERDAEIAAIDDALTTARSGGAAIVVVRGPAGTGKSRLADLAREAAGSQGMQVLFASGEERETEDDWGVAWQLFHETVYDASEGERNGMLAGAAPDAAPFLLAGPRNGVALEDPMALPHAVYSLLANLSKRRPLAIVIDDAHVADLNSLRLVLYLTKRLERFPVALVVAVGPGGSPAAGELLTDLAHRRGARVLRCLPLRAASVSAAIKEAFPEARDDVCAAAMEVTAGNPLLLTELVSELRALHIDPASCRPQAVWAIAPARVEEELRLRLWRREDGERALALARAAAVVGRDAELRHCAAIAQIDPGEAARMADVLVEEGVMRAVGRLEFQQPLVERVLYRHQPPAQRAEAHLRLARMLADERADLELVANHLLRSPPMGDSWVAETLTAAGAVSLTRGDPRLAIRYLRRAVEEPVSPDLKPKVVAALGRAEAAAGEPQGVPHLREAMDLLDDPHQRADVSLSLGRTMFAQGRLSGASEAFRRGAESAADHPELMLTLQTAQALASRIGGTGTAPAVTPDRALAAREPDSLTDRMLVAHVALSEALDGTKRDRLLDDAYRALAGGTLLREVTPEGVSFHFATMALVIAEDLQAADVAAAMAIDEATARGLALGQANGLYLRAWALARRGLLSAAADCAAAAIEHEKHGWGLGASSARGILAYALANMGRRDEARKQFDLAREHSPAEGELMLPLLEAARGFVHLEAGDAEAATADFRECGLTLARAQVANPACVQWRSGLALAERQLGKVEEAEELVAEELSLARSFGAPGAIARALRAQALLRGGSEQLEILEEAVDHARRSECLLDRAQVLISFGTALRRARKRRLAREPLREGFELAERCGASVLAERAQAELFVLGSRPRRAAQTGIASLTEREYQVALLMAAGQSNREVAEELFVTLKTVEWHSKNVFRKLGVSSRRELPEALRSAEEPRDTGSWNSA
jgi:DNA-binding CsgD family transcriptional regulator